MDKGMAGVVLMVLTACTQGGVAVGVGEAMGEAGSIDAGRQDDAVSGQGAGSAPRQGAGSASVATGPGIGWFVAYFDDYMRDKQGCQQQGDCVVVDPGCPLGCALPVARAVAAEVQAEARRIIADYGRRYGTSCVYECLPVGEPSCVSERCVVQ